MAVPKTVLVAQLALPLLSAIRLPKMIAGSSLEERVDEALVVTVVATLAVMVVTNLSWLHKTSTITRLLSDATLGLLVGIALFHVVTILFGAPVYHLVWRTFLLATLLASMTTVPAAMAFGTQQPLEWVDIVLTFRRGSSQETYVACTTIGAALGAYAGALPIPLDWDRPWQQWPLTCVYGCIGGHSFGLLLGAILIATSQRRLDGRKED